MKIITLIAAACIAAPVYAEEPLTRDDFCEAVADFAGSIMAARQGGVPLGASLEMVDGTIVPNIREMVIAAYDTPRYSSDEIRAEVILDFSNDIHLQCLTTDDYI